METLETLYTNLIQQHEHIQAANPYGCNQYGHRGGHQGGSKEQENNSNPENKKEQTQHTQTITTRANNAIADYDAFENEWDSDFGKRLRKTKYGPKMREDSGVAYEFKERIRRRLNEAKNKTTLTPEEENSLNKAIDDLEKLTKSMRQRKKRVDSETLQASAATLENEYQDLFQKQESIAAANPYGCNQYGHEWRAKHGQNTGKSTKDDIDREIDDYMKLSPEKKRYQLTNWRNEAARAEREWKNYTKTEYNPAYVKVHGRDDKPTEADRRDLEQKTRQRDQLEQKANELLQKNRERVKRVAQSQGRTPQEIEEHLNKYYPAKVRK